LQLGWKLDPVAKLRLLRPEPPARAIEKRAQFARRVVQRDQRGTPAHALANEAKLPDAAANARGQRKEARVDRRIQQYHLLHRLARVRQLARHLVGDQAAERVADECVGPVRLRPAHRGEECLGDTRHARFGG
jgi:hypothetical protein